MASTLCKDRKTLVLRCLAVPFWEAPTTTFAAANNSNQYPTIGEADATCDGNGNLATYNGRTYTYDSMNRLTLASASRSGHGFALSRNAA